MKILETSIYYFNQLNKTYLALFGVFILLVLLEMSFHSKIAKYIESTARSKATKYIPENATLTFTTADYSFFPPKIILRGIDAQTPEISGTIKSLSVYIQILPLIKGVVRLSGVTLDQPTLSIKIPKQSNQTDFDLSKYTYQFLYDNFPLNYVSLSDSKIILSDNKHTYSFDAKYIVAKKKYKKLHLEAKSKIDLSTPEFSDSFYFVTKLQYSEVGLFINFITLQKNNSLIQASGTLKKSFIDLKKFNIQNIYDKSQELRLSSNLELNEVSFLLKHFLEKELSNTRNSERNFSGNLQLTAYFQNTGSESLESSFRLIGKNLDSPFIKLNKIKASAKMSDSKLSFDSMGIHFDPQNSLQVKNLVLEKAVNEKIHISGQLSSPHIELDKVLNSLHLQVQNVILPFSIDTSCSGKLKPTINVSCAGNAQVKKFTILDSDLKNTLIDTSGVLTHHSVDFFKDHLHFSGSAERMNSDLKKDTAQAEGSVNYIKGFDIDFSTTSWASLDFINSIVGQKFSGDIKISGSTQGNVNQGTFSLTGEAQNLTFNDLYLGYPSLNLTYQFPNLKFSDIKGYLIKRQDSYTGDLNINVDKNKLDLKAKGVDISGDSVRLLFKKMFPFPEDINFTSNFNLHIYDHIDINKMDLNLNADIDSLNIFSEKFDFGSLSLGGQNGDWLFENSYLKKTSGDLIDISGSTSGLKTIDIKLDSKNLKLENSTFLRSIGVFLNGPVELNLSATGPLEGPKATGKITADHTLGLGGKPLGSSEIDYRIFQDDFYFKGTAANEKVNGEGYYPLSPKGRFAFNGIVNKLDILSLLNLNKNTDVSSEFLFSLESDFKTLDFTNSKIHGTLKSSSLELILNSQTLLKVTQDSPNVDLDNKINYSIIQIGKKAFLDLKILEKNSLELNYTGSTNLDFLKSLIPTTETLSGEFESEGLSLKIHKNSIQSAGRGFINKTIYKSDTFPIPITAINSEIIFYDNSLKATNLKAKINNTPVLGSLTFFYSPMRVSSNFKYQQLGIEFPKNVKTLTSGNLSLTGNSIPLTLSGNLTVHSGIFSQDFLLNSSTEVVTPNKRLPKNILQKVAPPVELNLDITIQDSMKVQNSEANGNIYGRLHASKNPTDPTLNGTIYLKPGFNITFNNNQFVATEGQVIYRDQLLKDARIMIDASTQVKDSNDPLETLYDVRMIAKGAATEPTLKFSSNPSLPEDQIVSLITIGTITTQRIGGEINSQQQATYSGVQLGSYLIQKNQALRDLQKKTGTEIGLGSSVNSGGVSQKVYVKKNWSPKVSSTISRTFGNQQNIEASTEYKLNRRTSVIFKVQDNQTQDTDQLINRRVREDVIFDLGTQYQFEFD